MDKSCSPWVCSLLGGLFFGGGGANQDVLGVLAATVLRGARAAPELPHRPVPRGTTAQTRMPVEKMMTMSNGVVVRVCAFLGGSWWSWVYKTGPRNARPRSAHAVPTQCARPAKPPAKTKPTAPAAVLRHVCPRGFGWAFPKPLGPMRPTAGLGLLLSLPPAQACPRPGTLYQQGQGRLRPRHARWGPCGSSAHPGRRCPLFLFIVPEGLVLLTPWTMADRSFGEGGAGCGRVSGRSRACSPPVEPGPDPNATNNLPVDRLDTGRGRGGVRGWSW